MTQGKKCLSQLIWDENLFFFKKETIPCIHGIRKGVIFVNDLVNANGSFMTMKTSLIVTIFSVISFSSPPLKPSFVKSLNTFSRRI